jgi:uncharacterized membrane protein YphA (DoxX/SURF4 family)
VTRVTLLARLVAGSVFLVAGALKAGSPESTVTAIGGFDVLPVWLVLPAGLALPGIEATIGAALLCGVSHRAAALLATCLAAIFLGFVASAMARNLDVACGCFGEAALLRADGRHLAFDGALLVAAALGCSRIGRPSGA